MDRDLHQNVVGIGLGVFDLDIEIAVLGKYAGVDQLEFRMVLAAPPVFLDQLRVGKAACGYL